MRGVHILAFAFPIVAWGSSPHARGPLICKEHCKALSRIIPACAGSTWPPVPSRTWCWDHPRMRGVHFCLSLVLDARSGSSPHARGPLMLWLIYAPLQRIIPACAGSTQVKIVAACNMRDHPRMRGVHLKKAPKNAILEDLKIPFHLTSQTQHLSTGNLPVLDVSVSPAQNALQS